MCQLATTSLVSKWWGVGEGMSTVTLCQSDRIIFPVLHISCGKPKQSLRHTAFLSHLVLLCVCRGISPLLLHRPNYYLPAKTLCSLQLMYAYLSDLVF
jgi:hypothetical protein